MARKILAEFQLGDTLVRYPYDAVGGVVGLELVPVSATAKLVAPRESLRGEGCIDVLPGEEQWPARPVESLLQFKLVGDPYPGAFVQGHSMRNAETLRRFRYVGQERLEEEGGTTIETQLKSAGGLVALHRLTWCEGDGAFTVTCSLENGSDAEVVLEMFASFSLAGITPFHESDAPGRLWVHRFRSGWSAEGRHERRSLEELHLERSWSGAGLFSERFGQVGTLPVRKWFPFLAVEDEEVGVFWGARVNWAGSWQMEVVRQHDEVAISGGLADREFGHWMKRLGPGETFEASPATLACVEGDLDDLCDRLTAMQDAAVNRQPEIEQDLPVVFNEWCTTWGEPGHEKLCAIADRLKGSGVRYLVIDAGWYQQEGTDWSRGHGDWIPSRELFPEGLKATADAIRERGLIPGLWFEMETVGSQSTSFQAGAHFLERDGVPVTVRERRFWDMTDPAAVEFLTHRVIDLLESCGFGYLKVDYNETAGLGCDDPDSLGEGLRKQVEGSYRFFEKIRERLPDLVVENCSSGGHRLEPSMMSLSALSSFSDAHELVEIPVIAANLHRLVLPRQSLIWAVLHPQDSPDRLRYSLAATFLGRCCLSGGIEKLSAEAWQLVTDAIRLYEKAAPVIKYGKSRRYGEMGASWRHPRGWQIVVRRSGELALIVAHAFGGEPRGGTVALSGNWQRVGGLGESLAWSDGRVSFEPGGEFRAGVLLLRRS